MSLDRETLLGYLLGALDPAEQSRVDRIIQQDPHLREELSKLRQVLDDMGLGDQPEITEPPALLADRTVDAILDSSPAELAAVAKAAEQSSKPPRLELGPLPQHYRLADWLMLSGILLAGMLFAFPVILESRNQARLLTCQDNLRQLGESLHSYSQLQPNHYFPQVSVDGNRGVAGVYAPQLMSHELVQRPNMVLCPSSKQAKQKNSWRVPTLEELDLATGPTLILLQETMGGSYGYHLGQMDQGELCALQDLRREHLVIGGDAPNPCGPLRRSMNHSLKGQNFLYEDGRVKFVVTVITTGDDPFVNDDGEVAAGLSCSDAVVGWSGQRPIPSYLIKEVPPSIRSWPSR